MMCVKYIASCLNMQTKNIQSFRLFCFLLILFLSVAVSLVDCCQPKVRDYVLPQQEGVTRLVFETV